MMNETILLIGNFLSSHGYNPTAIEELHDALSTKYIIHHSSTKQNRLVRLFDMIYLIINNRKSSKLIIVDVFGTYAFYYSALVIFIANMIKISYLPVFRGGSLPERYRKNPRLFNFIFNRCSKIICPSDYLANFFLKDKFPVEIIHNYIDIKKYKFKARTLIQPNLFWVRSIHAIYNPEMAIKVLFELRKIQPQAKLCMVGPVKDGSIHKMKLLIEELKLDDHVIISGKLAKEEWITLSSDYDIFINTTNFDNHPISIIEAMALGLPIVSTNVGGIPNLLVDDETAKLVQPNDVSSMVSKILEYISNDYERIQISNSARDVAVENYNKEKNIQKWFKIINTSINNG